MRRPLGFLFALLALWMQVLSPALAAHALSAAATLDPTAIICDHAGNADTPAPHDDHDAPGQPCCLGHHLCCVGPGLAARAAVAAPTARQIRSVVWAPRDETPIDTANLADARARGPPPV